jgi:phosphoglycolate phosphatase
MTLLLFDIDGTLLTTDGVGRRAVERSLSEITGCAVSTHGVTFSGKTDRQILREVLTMVDAEPQWLDGRFADCLAAYEDAMDELLQPETVTALPGATEVVPRLAQQDAFQLGLLTGNIRRMAYRKVAAIGLDGFFPFGAFGCDEEDRNALPSIATRRALAHASRGFEPHEVVIIGDTPRDVACARAHGAHVVALATGRFSADELAATEPDALLGSLHELEAALEELI